MALTVRAVVKGRLAYSVETRNMFEATTNDLTTLSAEQTVLSAWIAAIYAPFASILATAWAAYEVEWQIPITGGWQTASIIPVSFAGTVQGDFSSFQTAVLLIAKTMTKRVMGKKFFAGLSESTSTGGLLTSGALVYCATALAAWITPFNTSGTGLWYPGVTDKSGTFAPFIGGTVGSILSTMRRRKPGYGI